MLKLPGTCQESRPQAWTVDEDTPQQEKNKVEAAHTLQDKNWKDPDENTHSMFSGHFDEKKSQHFNKNDFLQVSNDLELQKLLATQKQSLFLSSQDLNPQETNVNEQLDVQQQQQNPGFGHKFSFAPHDHKSRVSSSDLVTNAKNEQVLQHENHQQLQQLNQ